MAYTTNQLISGAYYAAGIVSREFETVSGQQISDGLQWLNEVLADKDVDQGMIPYESTYNFTALTGVEKYFIPNLTQIDTLVFFLDQVRYAMKYTKRNQYFGSSRVENINTLPFQWYFERQAGGGNLYIYFKPDRNYPIEIHGAFNLNSVSLGQDLSANVTIADLGVPKFYFQFGSSQLVSGQLVVNDIDLMGIYSNIGALINYINSGIIPGVRASIEINDFVLSSTTQPPSPIYVRTNGVTVSGIGASRFIGATRFIGNVAAATNALLDASYSNGTDGVGATLTNAGVQAALIIDGVNVNLNDRILVTFQTNQLQNGSYLVSVVGTGATNWVLTRTTNYDQPSEMEAGDLFTATGGVTNAGNTFIQTEEVSSVGVSFVGFLNFSAITFSNFSTIETSLYKIFNANGFDQFYITYLRYALADRICTEYNYDVPVKVAQQLAEYESWIDQKSRIIDLQMQKVSTLQKRGSLNYAFVNLGKGWVKPG